MRLATGLGFSTLSKVVAAPLTMVFLIHQPNELAPMDAPLARILALAPHTLVLILSTISWITLMSKFIIELLKCIEVLSS